MNQKENTDKPAKSKFSEIASDIDEIGNDISSIWSSMSESIFGKKKSLEEIANCYGEICDKIIINSVKNEGLKYIAGKIHFLKIDNMQFECIGEFYFQNSSEKWIVKKAKSGNLKTARDLTPEATVELNSKEKISFEVDEPKL